MPQPCNGLAPEERADILRVRPQGALCAAIALLPLARHAMSDDIGTLAVWAMQDLQDHDVTR